jgi:hypothetical protein
MTHQDRQHRGVEARLRFRPAAESLEARLVLSASSLTVGMDATANGMVGKVATAHVLTIAGQAPPNASVKVAVGRSTSATYADASGHYQVQMAMAEGTYQVQVRSVNRSGHTARAEMTATMGDSVLAWDAVMLRVIQADAGNVGLASRTMAMVSGAVYDAVNDIERTGSVYKVDVAAPGRASSSAAASEAAYVVLSALDPSMQPTLDQALAESLAAIPSGTSRDDGVAVGRQVSQGILAWRANDGSQVTVPYVPGTAPGQWRPTPPTYQKAWGPEWSGVASFGVTRPVSDYLAPPPPALNSKAYAAALNQVKSLGALHSKTRTADQTQAGDFWAYDSLNTGTPPVHYDQIAATIALQQHNTMTQNARMFGLVNVAMGDAGIAAWDAKYTYNVWRPITAIRLASTDGNPATVGDPTWNPLGAPGAPGQPNFTPPFPGYVSGHATFGAALFTTLAEFYGTDKVRFTIGSDQTPGVARTYSSFSQASLENAWSRVYLGIHFWFDETAGISSGSAVARNVFQNVMTPLTT